ncbi:hypothetical protein AJ80_03288 [Polytolypa hystricis UAMH7299]|uniref:Large ribosomal subunit protein mL50 n=1 Tax=Polytolypa hystricis (strain UAMH7299) TaxID=1447883 RepID=A0A2B7YJZ3_POLH7|nr:hypothetical protein AJ80_03288 [Polytolypa hystricis UAMH7299]
MQSSARLLAPLEAASSQLSSTLYVCSTCRHQFLPQTLRAANQSFRRHNSSNNVPLTEKIRRKIWGTDNPPGLKDPYGGESILERTLRERQEAKQGPQQQAPQVPAEEVSVEEVVIETPSGYVTATTWDGLERVGVVGKWSEQLPTEQDEFFAFMSQDKASTREQFLLVLHETMVELLVLKEMDMPLKHACKIDDFDIIALLNQVQIKPSNDSSTGVLAFPTEQAKADVLTFFDTLHAAPGPIEASTEPSLESDQEYSFSAPTNTDFLSISLLEDPEFKFAFLKRVAQLTGRRIPDNEIANMTKPSHLLRYLITSSKPKPKKLVEELLANSELTSLPNVKISARRQTPIDKEKEIGRWKIIEAELTARGLPVTGRADI